MKLIRANSTWKLWRKIVINFITKCFSKVNSEWCFNIVEIFSPYPCTCQGAWQAVWFLAVRVFRRSQVRVGLWQGSGTSLPAGPVQRARADSADGPLELHIPAELPQPLLPERLRTELQEQRCRAGLGSAEGAQRCWSHRDCGAGAASGTGSAKTGLGVHLDNRGFVQSAPEHTHEALLLFPF